MGAMRLRGAAPLISLALLAIVPGTAAADSIVYEKDGNVWQAAPDGSNQRQVTTSGGYSKPTQADDGTILAFKDKLLHRMDRGGRVLNTAADPNRTNVTPITPHVSPDGTRVIYSLFHNGPILFGPYVATSYATRETARDEIDSSQSGYLNPNWLDNSRAVIFPQSSTIDAQIWTIPGGIQDWFTDPDPDVDLGGGEANAALTRFAASANGGMTIRLYRLNAPPPAEPEPRCELTGPAGSFFRPTWSPDGGSLAWQEDDGIWVGSINLDDCSATSAGLVIPGGKAPDWGPANVSTPAGGGGGGGGAGGADSVAPTLKVKAPTRISRRALLRGFSVRVTPERSTAARRRSARARRS